ncbi:HAD family hydrolase [Effusibacillus dendaii]|uniref:Uncharacterized protein n=1 Tax=Effusibacillus dendaii TaxID=2743772 RepID=A0A7I8DB10_9BACL|nr:HAD hydrolase-like protein [Effusibacillus dendaii]BCJ87373.1 hypothetical protein skT53_23580 [Effusibacillus dendaii]
MEIEAFVFDLDGTLFQTEMVAVPAFQHKLQRLQIEGLFRNPIPDESEITKWFGLTTDEIWSRLLPDVAESDRKKADDMLLDRGSHVYLFKRQGKLCERSCM